jgi:hypothetical protein
LRCPPIYYCNSAQIQQEATMSLAEIVHVRAQGPFGYKWRWQSGDGSVQSERSFDLYYECVEDAVAHGYHVRRPPPPAQLLTPAIE